MGSSEAGFHGLLQGHRDDASRWARPRRPSAGFCRAAAAMLPDGLVRGGFLRAFAGPPRRCLPMGSSEAAFCGVFQRRRCAQRRRSLLSFSPPPPGRTSFFTQPPAIGYRVRTPRRCFPLGSSEAATHGSSPLFLRAAAPVRGCSRRISPSISAPLCLPRRPLLCARPFRAGFFGSAPPCSPPPRAVSGPVPARADASRRSFAFPPARRAPFLPSAPCAPACASRRDGGSCKASCCALLHARPALKQRARNRRPASASPAPGLCARRARPGHPCRRVHPGRPCRCSPPFASVRIPPCSRFPFFSIARQESERKRRILYEHMFV